MVDLVKIRKKAKKKEEAAPPAEDVGAAGLAPPEAPAPEPEKPAGQAPPLQQATQAATSKLERFKEAAGKRREAEAAAQAAVVEETNADLLELLTFVIAGEHYAVDIERIVEIVTPRPVTRVPNADTSIVGIISLRGTIVTLVDVRRKLRHAASPQETADTRIIVIDFHGETVGFVVDRVLRVVKIGRGELEPHPVVHASELDESIRGVFRVSNALTILLDLDKLLDHRALAATVA